MQPVKEVISCSAEDLSLGLTQREVGAPASGDLNFGGRGDALTRRNFNNN